MRFTIHAEQMLDERRIQKEWVLATVERPDRTWRADDKNVHYSRAISDRQGRRLHVVVNDSVDPPRIVTVFFDRRLR